MPSDITLPYQNVMIMDELDITKLIQKQEEQTITATEYQQLKKWFDESADNQKTYRDYCVIYQGLKIEADKQRFERSKSAVWNRIKHRINPFSEQTQASHKIYALLRYAAIIIFALMIGGFVGHYHIIALVKISYPSILPLAPSHSSPYQMVAKFGSTQEAASLTMETSGRKNATSPSMAKAISR